MGILKCDKIAKLYGFTSEEYEINIAYESAYPDSDKKEICVSPRRKYSINTEHGTDVFLVVYCKEKSLYSVEKLIFDENGVTKLAPILDKIGVQRVPTSSEVWNKWKRYGGVHTEIFLFEKGYYTIDYLWLDCNVWQVLAYMPDGVSIDGKQLKFMYYSQAFEKIEDGFYDFLGKMLSDGCSIEEYKMFKEKYVHPSFENKFREHFE